VTEFWPSALRLAGGLDLFREVVKTSFSRVVDVRHAQAERRAETAPSSRIDDLVEGYAGPTDFTDLLLLP
jgi:hypothetical protein